MRRRGFLLAPAVAVMLGLMTSCTGTPAVDQSAPPAESSSPDAACDVSDVDPQQEYPDVLAAELAPGGDGFTVSVTICSPYDTPERYADGWRVLTPDGEVLAEHQLTHDHASEQPFTRTSSPFSIPDDIDQVTVEARDQANGYGGETVTIDVPR